MKTISDLIATLPQRGKIEWIGIREQKGAPVTVLEEVDVSPEVGLVGDRYSGRSGNRHVTLIQAEHMPAIAACIGAADVSPALLRRNLMVSGINLLALKSKQFRIGEAVFETTGLCHPCSQMEILLGPGGYNAMRGHGGITAKVLQAGVVRIGAQLLAIADTA